MAQENTACGASSSCPAMPDRGPSPSRRSPGPRGSHRTTPQSCSASSAAGSSVSSRRGAAGGYRLTREPEEISVWDAIQVLGGSLFPDRFCECHPGQNPLCRCGARTARFAASGDWWMMPSAACSAESHCETSTAPRSAWALGWRQHPPNRQGDPNEPDHCGAGTRGVAADRRPRPGQEHRRSRLRQECRDRRIQRLLHHRAHHTRLSVKAEFEREARERVLALEGVQNADVQMSAATRGRPVAAAREAVLPGVKNTIAVASGKGSIGKSTVRGEPGSGPSSDGRERRFDGCRRLDPRFPFAGRLGSPARREEDGKECDVPLQAHGLKLMSIGFLLTDDSPVIWRARWSTG